MALVLRCGQIRLGSFPTRLSFSLLFPLIYVHHQIKRKKPQKQKSF